MEARPNREELHVLVDRIPESDIAAARKILCALANPVDFALLNALADDEPLSPHEQAAWDAAERRRNGGAAAISHEELLSELGFSEADFQ